MAENKKSFILYADYIKVISKLPVEIKGQLLQLILDYVNDLNPVIENNLVLEIAFEPIRQQLKRDLKSWEEFKTKQSERGKLGGRPKNPENIKKPPLILESQKSLNVTVTDTVNVNERESPSPNFFYIGTELFKVPISHYLKSEKATFLEAWSMQNKEILIEDVFDIIDRDVGKTFGDHDHPWNYFKSTAKQFIKNNPGYKKADRIKCPYTDDQLRLADAQKASGFGTPEWFDKKWIHLLNN